MARTLARRIRDREDIQFESTGKQYTREYVGRQFLISKKCGEFLGNEQSRNYFLQTLGIKQTTLTSLDDRRDLANSPKKLAKFKKRIESLEGCVFSSFQDFCKETKEKYDSWWFDNCGTLTRSAMDDLVHFGRIASDKGVIFITLFNQKQRTHSAGTDIIINDRSDQETVIDQLKAGGLYARFIDRYTYHSEASYSTRHPKAGPRRMIFYPIEFQKIPFIDAPQTKYQILP